MKINLFDIDMQDDLNKLKSSIEYYEKIRSVIGGINQILLNTDPDTRDTDYDVIVDLLKVLQSKYNTIIGIKDISDHIFIMIDSIVELVDKFIDPFIQAINNLDTDQYYKNFSVSYLEKFRIDLLSGLHVNIVREILYTNNMVKNIIKTLGNLKDRNNFDINAVYQKIFNEVICIRDILDDYSRNIVCNIEIKSYDEKPEHIDSSSINDIGLKYLDARFVTREIWDKVSMFQYLSEDYIREHKYVLNWHLISKYQKLSEDFILEFKDKVDWNLIFKHQDLSDEFRDKFKCNLH